MCATPSVLQGLAGKYRKELPREFTDLKDSEMKEDAGARWAVVVGRRARRRARHSCCCARRGGEVVRARGAAAVEPVRR